MSVVIQHDSIRSLAPLHLATLFDGENGAIVCPATSEWFAVGTSMQNALCQRMGYALPLCDANDSTALAGVHGHVIAIGSASNNALLRQLHQQRLLAVADAPERGRRTLSVHNPRGDGANVLCVLGHTRAVAEAGARELIANFVRCEKKWGVPHPLLIAGCEFDAVAFERTQREITGGDPAHFATICKLINTLHQLRASGDGRWARLFIEGMHPVLTGEISLSFWSLSAPDFWTDELVTAWDAVEELPHFSNEERLLVVNFIIACARYCREALTQQKWRITSDDRQIFNHQTYPAKGLALAASYVKRQGYELGEADSWLALAQEVFARAARPGRSFDEGGPVYSWLVGRHIMEGTLALGDLSYVTSPQFKRYAELAVMCCNNHFDMVSFGDSNSYSTTGYNKQNSNGAALLLAAAQWQQDAGYRWVAERHAPAMAAAHIPTRDMETTPPMHHVGLVAMPLDPLIHQWASQPLFPGYPAPERVPNLPIETTFDKLSLRAGWLPRDDYLLLKGFGGGMHGHPDAGAIAQFQARGRLFLVEGDYIRRTPRDHNMVQIIHDGDFMAPPLNARLDDTVSFNGGAVVTVTLPGYNGCDWTRTLLWLANDFVLVIDSILAREPGEYDLSCYWRTLGAATAIPGGMITRQQDEWFRILELGGAEHSFELGDPPVDRPQWWPYEWGDEKVKVLRQRRCEHLSAGQARCFVNLLLPGGTREGSGHKISYQPGSLFVSGDSGEVQVNAHSINVAGKEVCRFTHALPSQVFDSRADRLRHLPLSATTAIKPQASLSLPAPVSRLCRWPGHGILMGTESGHLLLLDDEGELRCLHQTEKRITAIATGRLFGEPRESIVVTGDDERLHCLDTGGKLRWSATLPPNSYQPGRGTALAPADLDGDGRRWPIVGTAAWQVCAFAADGTPRWSFPTTAHAVTSLAVADLDGDGREEVIAGTVYFCVMAVNHAGERVWNDEDYNHFWSAGPIFPFVCAADVDGDGYPEILAAGHDTLVHCIDHRGKRKWATGIGDEPRALLLTPWGIFAASRSGDVHLLDGSGHRLWHRKLGSSCTCAVADAFGLYVATGENELFHIAGNGKIEKHIRVSHGISHIMRLDRGRLFVAQEESRVSIYQILKQGNDS